MDNKPNLHALLRDKYPAPKFVFQLEVPNGTSYNKTRSCDAICIGCWASVGIQIIGFEIKDSRSDWLKELQDPSKSQAWKQYCHSWYLVAQKGVAKLEELPASWGLMEPAGNGLKIRKACDIAEPKLMPVDVLAGLCRALKLGNESDKETKRLVDDAYERGFSNGKGSVIVDNVGVDTWIEKTTELKAENKFLREKYVGNRWTSDSMLKRLITTAEMLNRFDQASMDRLLNNVSKLRDDLETSFNDLKREIGSVVEATR